MRPSGPRNAAILAARDFFFVGAIVGGGGGEGCARSCSMDLENSKLQCDLTGTYGLSSFLTLDTTIVQLVVVHTSFILWFLSYTVLF